MNDIKTCVDSIQIDAKLKEQIYNNIIERAKTETASEPPKVIRPNFRRYIPYITAACFVTVMCFCVPLYSKPNVSPTPSTYNLSVVRMVGVTFTAYMPDGDNFKELTIEDCPCDPIFAWNELLKADFVPSDLKLQTFEQNDNCLTLIFNDNLEKYRNEKFIEAIKKTFNSMYPDFEIDIK